MSNISFVNIEESEFLSNKLLFKYLDLEHALELIKTQKIWVANPTIWTDPFESRFISAKYNGENFSWKDKVFCTCFTNASNSEAFWKAYSNNDICVKFSIYRKILLEILDQYANANKDVRVYIGKVEYMMTRNIIRPLNQIPFDPKIVPSKSGSFYARLLLLKRKAFQFDDEYRIMIVKNRMHKTANGIYIPFNMDPKDLIERITMDPKLSFKKDTYKNAIKECLSNGQQIKVFQSNLYKTNGKQVSLTI